VLTKEASTNTRGLSTLLRRMAAQAHDLRAELAHEPDADSLAQAIVCAAPILAAAPSASFALSWLVPQLEAWEQRVVGWAVPTSRDSSNTVGTAHPTAHLYESFLHVYAKTTRKRHGVYFTPEPIADYIVTQIDRLLRDQFDLPPGLAQSPIPNPKSQILLLDPACGTGIFLLSAIDHLHRYFALNHSAAAWNAFVPDLLSRLIGIEILPAAAFLAKLNIAIKLAETGYDFASPAKLNILTGDALSPEIQSQLPNLKSQIPVVLGNPPFSSLSTNTNPWIARLVRGDEEIRGYIRANGQQLGERKTWLHDDYVKFIRLAQWHIEQAGCGIVGFVTNHGYLDNATFRLMRHELLRVFPHIQIVDLHGNRRGAGFQPAIPTRSASEGSPSITDENIFGLDQGLAISILSRPATTIRSVSEGSNDQTSSRQTYSDLWGSRTSKLAALTSDSHGLQTRAFTPHAPDWRFIPAPAAKTHPEYASSWSLADAMPVNTTAPVTARDHFVVAFTVDELKTRIEAFRDLSIPDGEIRDRYFTRTRSARYQIGDTRGWQLAEARRIVAADGNWQRHIIRCLYRPFDWRYVFWHPAMIDWPRTEVTRHLVGSGFRVQGSEGQETPFPEPRTPNPEPSLCLIARRQQLPTQPCTFFWITDCLALDGVIRSDNRGSESLFPLCLLGTERQANFASAFIEQFAGATKLTWLPHGRGDLTNAFGPEDLLAYIYALFHSQTYRERYADSLRTAFPRVLMPKECGQFVELSRLGRELMDLHMLSQPSRVLSTEYSVPSTSPPSFSATPHSALRTPHLPALSSFRAGGYPALRKWLQPRHRSATDTQYAHIAAAIARTLEIMPAIDQAFTAP
jgi:hypothetical protein